MFAETRRIANQPIRLLRILGEGGPRGAVDEGWRSLYCTKDKRTYFDKLHQESFVRTCFPIIHYSLFISEAVSLFIKKLA